ncbi:J domain-containing protein [Natrarchaeobius halalkaliphilus]|uniref:J domain-containing protein n=1 Tax=Natrarchaeobius halalkaliphilus TaxID=1679091 RepID=A0A3N6P3R7_9EURY|nr:DnaJ domain-containing protein [Natrarchaeobius halalkaliphilus]RQG89975.1 J domain-containing protein [Natrarchaeobius halalkaliphilus]
MTADFYDLLEIPPDASPDEIKDAYREKVRVYHPDVNDDDRARAQFTAVKKAHDILGDPTERKAYDRLGHREYVAKRTSGIPSPDVWTNTSETSTESGERRESTTRTRPGRSSSETAEDESTAGTGSTTSDPRSSRSRRSSTAASTRGAVGSDHEATATRTEDVTTSATGTRTTSTGTSATSASGRATASSAGADSTTAATEDHGVSSTDGGTAHGHRRSQHSRRSDARRTGRIDGLVRWWRRRNVALPAIWLAVLVYVAGLGHAVSENEAAVDTLRAELAAVGGDVEGVLSVLSSGRYGLDSSIGFVSSVELVPPFLESVPSTAVLAGIVGVAFAVVLFARLRWREDTWGPITIDETILIALAVTVPTSMVGGPLLSGAVLMPFLFGVVVYHTRRGPGWQPSYLYVLPVLAPALGFAAGLIGEVSLVFDLVAFVLLPMIGALGLPLRATIRKHMGR